MLIEISSGQIEKLLMCRKTKDRCFEDWNIEGLLNEAIYEFYEKYYKK